MFTRYAVYYTPVGGFADAGAAWLGWDSARARPAAHPDLNGVELGALTQRPRKYGFHATIKAPFALAQHRSEAGLRECFKAFCASCHPADISEVGVATLGRIAAIVPQGATPAVRDLAARAVQDLDTFRAPLTEEEIARRRKSRLTQQQEANLMRWGYPHVMEAFNFHMTLTGPVPRAQVAQVEDAARGYFAPLLPRPFTIDALTLMGERKDGMVVALERHSLGVQEACTHAVTGSG